MHSRIASRRCVPALPYSLALRLRDAGVAIEVVCEYLDVEEASLEGLYRMAEAKLSTARNQLEQVTPGSRCPPLRCWS